MQKLLVVGAGLVGLAVASRLASYGQRVTLIDKSRRSPSRGGREDWVLVDPTAAPTAQVAALIGASHQFLLSPPRYFGPLLRPGGVVHLAATTAGFRRVANLVLQAQWLGLDGDLLGKDDLLKQYPALMPDAVAGGLLLSGETAPQLDVAGFYEGLMKRFVHRSGQVLRETELLGAEFSGGAWRIETNRGRLAADVLVNAAGVEAEAVAARCGVACGRLVRRKRTVVVGQLDTVAGRAAPAVPSPLLSWLDANEGLQFRVEPHGEIRMSPVETGPVVSVDPVIDGVDAAMAIERLEARTRYRLSPHPRTHWTKAMVSRQKAVGDDAPGDPLISWDGRARSFFWVAGFDGLGAQCASAVGDLAADALLGSHRERRLYDEFDISPSAFELARL